MDNSQYICFCRKIFHNRMAFKAHLPCIELVNAVNKNAKFDIIPTKQSKEVRIIQRSFRPTETVIKIMKIADVPPKEKQMEDNAPPVTAHIGKRLPSRTKVPFLSRAVPLSTDHSFERCTCGAVFVTRVGKRQHQARFCKLAKNKSKNKCTSNVTPDFMENIQTVSTSELGNEFTESDESIVSDIYNEQSIIQYEINDNCVM